MSGLDAASAGPRLASLDQFRGYTVAGMIAVNFLGGYDAVGPLWKHHNTYCSYADTIMPQFFLAVGYAYRLTYLRRVEREGARAARGHALRRALGLLLVGLVFHGVGRGPESWEALRQLSPVEAAAQAFSRVPFQALVHIAVTSLWILPVIGRSAPAMAAFRAASAGLHLGLSAAFYREWAWTLPVIDGGPLGFLSWTIPTLTGALACDVVAARGPRNAAGRLAVWSIGLMAAGYGLSCLQGPGLAPPPFVPPPEGSTVGLWTMSQRTGSVSYQTFGAGFALAVAALFLVTADVAGLRIGLFRTFGRNALAAYLLHPMVGDFVASWTPHDAPLAGALAACTLNLGLLYLFLRGLERQGVFIRL